MTGRTHLAMGVAAALLAAGPAAGLTGLVTAAAGGAAGAVLPDLDVRDTAHPWRERLARAGAAALLVGALVADAATGWPLVRRAAGAGLGSVALGAVSLAALCCAARLSAHRSFSHSLPALAGFSAATHLVCAPLAPFVAVGMASHLMLDLLTHRGLRLLWPARHGFSLGLCRTGGVVDACCLAAALSLTAGVIWTALG